MKRITKQNATFKGGEPTWANACVGENGNPQIYEYASGYASAANLLLDQVIGNESVSIHVDTLIYPICFNMRHAIELFLKATAISLERLTKIRSCPIPVFDLEGSHDLGNIWAYVRTHALGFDPRFVELVEGLDQYVVDVADIDATGQVFRYPFDLENNKHLVSVSVINMLILKRRWAILEDLLRNLNRLANDLLAEYGWHAFTAKLSRQQLARIAKMLPPRDRWSFPEFDQVKLTVRNEYNLSSNDFSKALDVIQSRRELAAFCAHVPPIPWLDAAVLGQFLDIWLKQHDLRKIVAPPVEFDPALDFTAPSFVEMISHHERSAQLSREIVETIKPEAFAALRALFYFDSEENFSEIFEKFLVEEQKIAAKYVNTPANYLDDAGQLLAKTSVFTRILNSLNFLGQTEVVKVVIERYQLHDQISKLLEPSNRAREQIVRGYSYL